MPERKSSRSRKTVDYARFGGDEDLDDDFADATPPLSKRPKLANKENVAKKDNTKGRKEPKKRNAEQEKMFELELQAALELSMSQSEPSQEAEPTVTMATKPQTKPQDEDPPSADDGPPNIVELENDNTSPSPILPKIDNPPVLAKFPAVDNDIVVLDEDVDEGPSSRRRARKPKKYIASDSESDEPDFEIDLRKYLKSPLTPKVKRRNADDDSDFAPARDDGDGDDDDDDSDGDSEDSTDDYNEDDSDDDFGIPKKKNTKKAATSTPKPAAKLKTSPAAAKPTKSQTAPSKPAVTKPAAAKSVKTVPSKTVSRPVVSKSPAITRPVVSKSPAMTSPVTRTPAAGLTRKTPNWTPPASTGSSRSPMGAGVSLTSPTTGLRIGLSRNMKLKPLHPNLKMSH